MASEENQAKLIEAARYGSEGGVKFFLKRVTSLEGVDDQGWTALHWCAFKPAMGCLTLLLAAAADANVQNLEGDTPLHLAAKLGHVEIQRALIKAGGDITVKNAMGKSPADLAKARVSGA